MLSIMIGGFRGSTGGAVGDGIGAGGGWLKFTSTRITSDDRTTITMAMAFRSIRTPASHYCIDIYL
jgi:hypothetical protein